MWVKFESQGVAEASAVGTAVCCSFGPPLRLIGPMAAMSRVEVQMCCGEPVSNEHQPCVDEASSKDSRASEVFM